MLTKVVKMLNFVNGGVIWGAHKKIVPLLSIITVAISFKYFFLVFAFWRSYIP